MMEGLLAYLVDPISFLILYWEIKRIIVNYFGNFFEKIKNYICKRMHINVIGCLWIILTFIIYLHNFILNTNKNFYLQTVLIDNYANDL